MRVRFLGLGGHGVRNDPLEGELGWANYLGDSMIQVPRVEWRLLATENGASPDWIIVVVVCGLWIVVCDLLLLWWWWFGHDVIDGSLAMPHHGRAPNYECRDPVDTVPRPCNLRAAPQKNHPISSPRTR